MAIVGHEADEGAEEEGEETQATTAGSSNGS
jgi:hypothetical protein